eukprot:m.80559 g.80559  ORF g.80559 m.80559 type:complete len:315 (-) comp16298_c0_seq3:95-1039(-)
MRELHEHYSHHSWKASRQPDGTLQLQWKGHRKSSHNGTVPPWRCHDVAPVSASLQYGIRKVSFLDGYAVCDGALCSHSGFPCIHLVTAFGGVLETADLHPRYHTMDTNCHTAYRGVKLSNGRKLFDSSDWSSVHQQSQHSDMDVQSVGQDSDTDKESCDSGESAGLCLTYTDVTSRSKLIKWYSAVHEQGVQALHDAINMTGDGTLTSQHACVALAKHIETGFGAVMDELQDIVRANTDSATKTSDSSVWGGCDIKKSIRTRKTSHDSTRSRKRLYCTLGVMLTMSTHCSCSVELILFCMTRRRIDKRPTPTVE